MTAAPGLRRAGDRGVLIEVADNQRALELAEAFRARLGDVLEDVVPGHRTLLVTWRAGAADPTGDLLDEAARTAGGSGDPAAPEPVELGVRYDGPDLGFVAGHAGLTRDEVIEAHSAATYRVAFVGFAPGFAYLIGGDRRLEVPRRADPRPQVPAGSVGLAGPYTAVYPRSSPGGWQVIGCTDEALFDIDRDPPARLLPGMTVRFRPQE
jgi:allophanate hydrolase subunit 1